MAYQALYREWRSQTFDDLIGQRMVTQTLKRAIIQNKVSHAYLFTGPRGTGKTSAAKIFAKAINCLTPLEGEPCNTCQNCIGITEGRIGDVLEIDAASNNGVEEIREIRDKVKYAPTQTRYKVYIIDEVHMLSTGAFNALLKTLEEPPNHVIFILATTEPHKIPTTIISRTQRFDFKRIGIQDIIPRLAHILEQKGISYEENVLRIIARSSEGGMRDALSILDQVISFSGESLTVSETLDITGSLNSEMMDTYLKACHEEKTNDALMLLTQLLNEGKDSQRIVDHLLLHCRDLLMYQQVPQFILEQAGELPDSFIALSEQLSSEQLYTWINELNDTQKNMRFSNQPSVYLDVMTVKLSQTVASEKTFNISQAPVLNEVSNHSELNQKILELEKQIQSLQQMMTQPEKNQKSKSTAIKPKKLEYKVSPESVFQVLEHATKSDLIKVKEVWNDLLQMLTVTQRAMLKASEPMAASPTGLVVSFEYDILCQKADADLMLQQSVRDNLNRLIGYTPTFVCVPKSNWMSLREQFINQMDSQKTMSQDTETENVLVQEAQKLFGDQNVRIVED